MSDYKFSSFPQSFKSLCEKSKLNRALIDSKTGKVWSYEALNKAVVSVAGFLHSKGLRPGDRVLSVLPNGFEQLVFLLGAWWLGVDYCPLSPQLTKREIQKFLELVNPNLSLVPQKIDPQIVALLSANKQNEILTLSLRSNLDSILSEDKFELDLPILALAPKLVLYTSGTDSEPKIVVFNANKLWASADLWANHHSFLNQTSRFYNILPMSTLGGIYNLGLIPLAARASIVLADAFSAKTAINFWKEIRDHNISVLWLNPTIIRILLSLHKTSEEWESVYKQIGASFTGMAPISLEEVKLFKEKFGIKLLDTYGLTETTFLSSQVIEDATSNVLNVGKTLPWVELSYKEENDLKEIKVKTPFLFDGYLIENNKLYKPLDADGYFLTGDIAQKNDDGTLSLKGRKREVIKKGGYLIYLNEIKELALKNNKVRDAEVLSVEHEFYGEHSVLFLEVVDFQNENLQNELEEMKEFFSNNLAKFKWPEKLVIVEALPKSALGKVKKMDLISLARDSNSTNFTIKMR